MERIKNNSLWLIGIGLMLASSGLDGTYIARWMPVGWGWLGFVLNTTSDIASQILMYWFSRLYQSRKGTKRQRLAYALIPAEVVAVAYSWLFSYLQLRIILPGFESAADVLWIAPLAAGFIPLLLLFIGLAQGIMAGKLEDRTPTRKTPAARHRTPGTGHSEDTYQGATRQPLPEVSIALLPDTATDPTPASQPATGPPEPATKQTPIRRQSPAPEDLDTDPPGSALAGHLYTIKERIAQDVQQGKRESRNFRRTDVEQWLGVSESHAKNIIRYGKSTLVLVQKPGYFYGFA